jgi:cytochrome c
MLRELLIAGTVAGACALAALSVAPASAQTPTAGDEDAGAEYYGAECRVCHGGVIAPSLRGVVGRKIASLPGYGGYSDALKAKSGTAWTPELLDAFLKGPSELVPGTKMEKVLPDAQMRADIIAYLKSLPAPN